jgi:MoaA/NifB/PqqE/SkfB family radical SAM enzyme
MSTIYSQAKPLYHIDRVDALRQGVTPAPVHVQLILSDLCNQDCSFCAYRISSGLSTELFKTPETHNPNRRMDTQKAFEIITDCAEIGVRAIQFTGGGEPTVHKDWYKLILYAQKLGLETALVTNGVRMANIDALVSLAWLRVSIDAGSARMYSSVRRVSEKHWLAAWDNLKRAVLVCQGTVGVGYVVTPDNFHGIAACAERARDSGADNIRIGAVFSKEGLGFYDKVEMKWILKEIDKAKALQTDKFEVIDLFGRRFGDLEGGSPEHPFCGYQYFTTYIGADLNVYRCCNTAYTTPGLLGNLKDVRFADFMPDYTLDARNCQFCQFQGQNEAINAALQTPTHPDFV